MNSPCDVDIEYGKNGNNSAKDNCDLFFESRQRGWQRGFLVRDLSVIGLAIAVWWSQGGW